MGESNCAWSRQPMLHRDTISAACAIYQGINKITPVLIYIYFGYYCLKSQTKSDVRLKSTKRRFIEQKIIIRHKQLYELSKKEIELQAALIVSTAYKVAYKEASNSETS